MHREFEMEEFRNAKEKRELPGFDNFDNFRLVVRAYSVSLCKVKFLC